MILRALLALIACLLALLPAGTLASIPRTAFVPPPVALFGVEFSDEQDCGPLTLHLDGLHDRAGPCGGVLVRQNPWSAFDPEGLFEWKNVGQHLLNNGANTMSYGNDLLGSAFEILSLGTNGTRSSERFTNKTLGMVAGTVSWGINDLGSAMRGTVHGVSHGNFESALDQGMSAFGDTHEEQVANLITMGLTGGAGRFLKGKGAVRAPEGNSARATRTLTAAERKTYDRVSPRKTTREAVWEKYADSDGNVRDAVTGKVIEPGSSWVMGHKSGYELTKMQFDAADRRISRKQWIEEQNNPNLYQPELPSTSSRGAHEAPKQVTLPSAAAGTAHEDKY